MNFNRQKLLRWIKPIGLILIGAILGCFGVVTWFCLSKTKIVTQPSYDPWQISYYIFQIIGVIGTVAAVIVALFKEAIMKWLYAPSLKISLIDNGITENLSNETQRVPEAIAFECFAQIENVGSLASLGCKVNISDIKFGKTKSSIKSIKTTNTKQLWWSSQAVDIPIGIPSKIKLFEIVNPNSVGTPSSTPNSQKALISFNGCELKKHHAEKGVWIIEYFISSKNGEAKLFETAIEWNGEFKSRATDMAEILKVQIEEK